MNETQVTDTMKSRSNEHLRCHVVWRAAERVGRPVQEDLQLAHSKVRDSDVTLKVQQHIVQLEIPIHNAFLVQEIQARPDLGGVEARMRLREPAGLLYVEHQVAAVEVLHDEEEVRVGLEGAEQVAEVRMPRRQRQHLPLDQRALHVVVLEDHVLLQALDGVYAFRAAQLGQQDLAEAAFT